MFTIPQEHKDFIEDLTYVILSKYNIKFPTINYIDNLIDAVGGKMIKTDKLDPFNLVGVSKTGDMSFSIYIYKHINKKPNYNKKNFYCAAILPALAYLFIFMGYRTNIKTWNQQEANIIIEYENKVTLKDWQYLMFFTNAILMPKEEYLNVLKRYANQKMIMVDITLMLKYFRLSIDMVRQRGLDLNVFKPNF